jgi:hypothetical protein
MSSFDARISRRHALALGGGIAAGGVLSTAAPATATVASPDRWRRRRLRHQFGSLPVDQMQEILQAEGMVTDGVLSIDIERTDMPAVAGPLGVTFTPAFELDGMLAFQPMGDKYAFFNGMTAAIKAEEANPVIDAIIANGLIFQAYHQHYVETSPNVWFIHFRGGGNPLTLAQAVRNVFKATSTPFPQTMPSNPTTPLDADRLGSILRGDATVGDEGVVTVNVERTDRIVIDDIIVSPELNISTDIEFKPLSSSGSNAAAAPDFSLTSFEVQPVVALMRKQGWFDGCLYNQETNEYPQLYFSHMLNVGDAYTLAQEVRNGLDLTASQ